MMKRLIGRKNYWILLYVIGVGHWLAFYFLVAPVDGFGSIILYPDQWFAARVFTVNDWFHDWNYMRVVQEALQTATMPYHVNGLGQMNHVESRFLGATIYITSPQIILLYWLEPSVFVVVNHLIMYSVGFYGCLMIRDRYQLGIVAFTYLFILFNFNGYLVGKVAAYGSWEMGEYLMPYFVFILFGVMEFKDGGSRSQIRWGLYMAIALTALLYQATMNLYVHCITFIAFWTIANYKLWRFSAIAIFATFAMGCVRLLPMVFTRGSGMNEHYWSWGGYSSFDQYVKALVVPQGILDAPAFAWWEFSLFVSLPALFFLVYFSIWAGFINLPWQRFSFINKMALPLVLFQIISIRHLKHWVIPNWVPFLNAEGTTTRYMIVPLVVIIVIASINYQGFIDAHWKSLRVKILFSMNAFLVLILLFLHSKMWRMHLIQRRFEEWLAEQGQSMLMRYETHHALRLAIDNKIDDVIYIGGFWVGFVGSMLSIAVIAWWLWDDRRKKIGQKINTA
jgi:hypothetical protein